MNKTYKMIIDTDPGIDDAVALGFAIFNENIDVKLITTVAGNVSVQQTTTNVLKLLKFWNKNIPVASGADEPLNEKFVDSSYIHGETGLSGFEFDDVDLSAILSDHAIVHMKDELMRSKDKMIIMAIGPLTNIALLLKVYPYIKTKIKEIVVMGGSLTRGNKTIMGEFNIATDPEAAKIVFSAGVKVVLVPLDIGLQALIFKEQLEKIRHLNKTGAMFYQLFCNYRSGNIKTGLRIYDSYAIGYITNKDMYKIQETFIDVETSSTLTRGITLIDLERVTKQKNNIFVCVEINTTKFYKWFIESLKKCS